MKVILKQTVEHLGDSGEVVNVKPGYARNYLLPQGLAYEASEANVRRLEEEQTKAEERAKRDFLEARRRASLLEGVSLLFRVRAGEGEDAKLFGSVTSADIAEQLAGLGLDFDVDKRQVVLEEPIKALGDVQVPIRLHSEVIHEIEVKVVREDA